MTPWRAFMATVGSALRDRGLVFMFVAAVPIYSFFYPLPYATQSVRNVALVVVDLDGSPMSRDIESRLSAVAAVRISGSASTIDEASGALASGQIAGIVLVPANFSRDAARGTPTAVTVFGTGAYPVQDKAVLGSVGAVVQGVAGEVAGARMARQGAPAAALLQSASAGPAFIDQSLYNLARGYGSYVVAAVSILIVQQVMLMAIAALVGTWLEARAGTLFGSQEVGLGALLGTIAGFALFVFLALLWFIGFAFWFQDYPRGGHLPGAVAFAALTAVTIASLGIALGAGSRPRARLADVARNVSAVPVHGRDRVAARGHAGTDQRAGHAATDDPGHLRIRQVEPDGRGVERDSLRVPQHVGTRAFLGMRRGGRCRVTPAGLKGSV